MYELVCFLGLKPGGQYEVQVLGATQNGLPNVDLTWYYVELPAVNPILPVPTLNYKIVQSSIEVCSFMFNVIFNLVFILFSFI